MTLQALSALVGATYFHVKEESKYFSIWTRKNGCSSSCWASPYDIEQARAIAQSLRSKGIDCSICVVDEWVEVVVKK